MKYIVNIFFLLMTLWKFRNHWILIILDISSMDVLYFDPLGQEIDFDVRATINM